MKEQERLVAIEDTVRRQTEQIDALRVQYQDLQKAKEVLRADNKQNIGDLADYKNRKEVLEKEVSTLRTESSELKESKAEHSGCAEEKKALEEQVTTKDSSINRLTKELGETKAELQESIEKLRTSESSAETLAATN